LIISLEKRNLKWKSKFDENKYLCVQKIKKMKKSKMKEMDKTTNRNCSCLLLKQDTTSSSSSALKG
jgi:hypothetical protein